MSQSGVLLGALALAGLLAVSPFYFTDYSFALGPVQTSPTKSAEPASQSGACQKAYKECMQGAIPCTRSASTLAATGACTESCEANWKACVSAKCVEKSSTGTEQCPKDTDCETSCTEAVSSTGANGGLISCCQGGPRHNNSCPKRIDDKCVQVASSGATPTTPGSEAPRPISYEGETSAILGTNSPTNGSPVTTSAPANVQPGASANPGASAGSPSVSNPGGAFGQIGAIGNGGGTSPGALSGNLPSVRPPLSLNSDLYGPSTMANPSLPSPTFSPFNPQQTSDLKPPRLQNTFFPYTSPPTASPQNTSPFNTFVSNVVGTLLSSLIGQKSASPQTNVSVQYVTNVQRPPVVQVTNVIAIRADVRAPERTVPPTVIVEPFVPPRGDTAYDEIVRFADAPSPIEGAALSRSVTIQQPAKFQETPSTTPATPPLRTNPPPPRATDTGWKYEPSYMQKQLDLAQAQSDFQYLEAQIDAWRAWQGADLCDASCRDTLSYLETQLPLVRRRIGELDALLKKEEALHAAVEIAGVFEPLIPVGARTNAVLTTLSSDATNFSAPWMALLNARGAELLKFEQTLNALRGQLR